MPPRTDLAAFVRSNRSPLFGASAAKYWAIKYFFIARSRARREFNSPRARARERAARESTAKTLSRNCDRAYTYTVSPIAVLSVICINPDTHKITTMMLEIINTVTLFPRQRNWRHPVKYVITKRYTWRTIKRERARDGGGCTRSTTQYQIAKSGAELSEVIIGSTMAGRASPIVALHLILRLKGERRKSGAKRARRVRDKGQNKRTSNMRLYFNFVILIYINL